MKKIILLLITCFGFAAPYISNFFEPDIYYVNDNGTGDGSSWNNASGDLQSIINGADSGDEIWVAAGIYQPASGQSFIMKEGVKIYGGFAGDEENREERDWLTNLTTLQGNDSSVIFNDDNGLTANAILDGFTITGGSNIEEANGGGMYNYQASPTVINCIFTGNYADNLGGGIYNDNAGPIITNCTFTFNEAGSGGGLGNITASPVITNCTFTENIVSNFGGGIANSYNSDVSITGCTFTENMADSWGGGIHNEASAVIITNCTFSANMANGGGGIGNYNLPVASVTITGCSFTNNTATELGGGIANSESLPVITNCVFNGNYSDYRGGGIANIMSSPAISYCSFTGNTADWQGGGIYNETTSSPAVINSLFTDNTVTEGNGGAMYNYENSNPVITNSTFAKNAVASGYEGGAMYNDENSNPVIANAIIYNNNSGITNNNSTPVITYSLVQGMAGGSDGNLNGTVAYPGLFADITNDDYHLTPVITNVAINAGHNGSIPEGITTDLDGNARIKDGTVDLGAYELTVHLPANFYVDNAQNGDGTSWANAFQTLQAAISAAENGDSIFVKKGVYLLNSTVTLKNGVKLYGSFDGTETSLSERNLLMEQEEMTILDGQNQRRVMIANNNGVTSSTEVDGLVIRNGRLNGTADYGAGIWIRLTSPTIRNCIFSNNWNIGPDQANGGAVRISNGSPSFTNCIFTKNQSTNGGAAMYIGSDSNSIITNCLFSENSSNGGGALFIINSNPTIVNSTLTNNHASHDQSGGGGIYIVSSNVTLKNTIIFGNTSANSYKNVRVYSGTYTLFHSLLEDYSITENGNVDATGLTMNNLFYLTHENDFRLKPVLVNPAINAGDNSSIPEGIETDLLGNDRIVFGTVDLGAYEAAIPVIYVDDDKNGDGSSWANAFHKLEDALAVAQSGDNIIVAAGTYQPASGQYFTMKEGVKIYGGFAGYETFPRDRDLSANISILQGNNNRVIRNVFTEDAPMTQASVLDGFTVMGGSFAAGGGMYNSYASPTVANCIFTANEATGVTDGGGGMFNNHYSSPLIINCIFSDNTSAKGGGGMQNADNSSPIITNCTIADNTANGIESGGGIFNNTASHPVITNTIVLENNTGIANNASTPVISYSLVQGMAGGANGNMDGTVAYPGLFIDITNDDYHLTPVTTNVAINTGNNASIPEGITTDLDGNSRIKKGIVDLGAYELTVDLPLSFYVDDDQNGNGRSWANAFQTLQQALAVAESTDTIFVAEGTYQPASGESFAMKEGVKILGGYPNGGGERDWATHVTILQGNSGRVIRNNANGLTNAALLDGFTITGGSFAAGGGMYNNEASPTIANCIFTGNAATGSTDGGGAMFNNHSSSPLIVNCIFDSNSATEGGGGIQNSDESSPLILNSLFESNESATMGAAIFNKDSDPIIINCTIVENEAPLGAGIRNSGSNPVIQNTIIFGNNSGISNLTSTPLISYSLVQGNSDTANGNIDATGLTEEDIFTDASNNNYTPVYSGSAYNTGNNSFYTNNGGNLNFDLDLAGLPRLYESNIDLGAYEAQSLCPSYTKWNGFSWSNGEPDSDKLVIINGDLTLNEDLTACELMVAENGNLTIPDGFSFIVNNKIINNAAAADFVVANDGNLIQNEDVENTGEITVIRESQPMVRLDYTMWSSPVLDQNLFGFSPETVNGVTNYSGFTGRIYIYDGADGYQNPDPFNEYTTLASGVGYLFRAPNNWTPDTPVSYNGVFTGVPFNGNLSVGTHMDNYTSVGNPYPSNINTNNFISANPGISTLYFWNNNHSAGNNYATCVFNNCVAATGGGNIPDGIITVGQGFIVYTTSNSVNFSNDMRINNAGAFFKTDETEIHRIWLNLSDDQDQGYNQILVGYMTGATNSIDNQIDGKLFGYEGSALYNIIDEDKFVIQGRALPFEASDVVPLGFRATEARKFIISLADFDGLFTEGEVTVYLKDNELNITHNLMESDYTFEAAVGEFKERFEVVYGTEEVMGTGDLTSNSIQIYKHNKNIVVSSKTEKILSVELFDMQGRNIHRNDKVNANHYQIRSNSKGVLVVKVETQNGEVVTKKVINK